jgi:hypothetical protein
MHPPGSLIPWLYYQVVSWFRNTRGSLFRQYNTSIPSLAFVHIPISAMLDFQNEGVSATKQPGINDDVPLDQQGMVNGEYTGADIPFMQALLETEGLMGLFSGHDHGNDWYVPFCFLSPIDLPPLATDTPTLTDSLSLSLPRCFKWTSQSSATTNTSGSGNLHVCFGRHTGYGGYGTWTRGSRQILLREDNVAGGNATETWIRLEDGTESGRVILNSTFGTDVYPKVKNSHTDL